MTPVIIKVEDNSVLYIQWEDKSDQRITLKKLRENCPCAICLTERYNRPETYIPLFSKLSVTIKDIKLTGSYAIQIFWGDGHNTGIYTYEYLRQLS